MRAYSTLTFSGFCGSIPRMNKTAFIIAALLLITVPKTPVQAAAISVSAGKLPFQVSLKEVVNLEPSALHLQDIAPDPAALVLPVPSEQPRSLKEIADEIVVQKLGANQVAAFNTIITLESNWDPNAVNPYSGAFGLGQALPASKIGPDRSPVAQINWILAYIEGRYGTANRALAFHLAHGWY